MSDIGFDEIVRMLLGLSLLATLGLALFVGLWAFSPALTVLFLIVVGVLFIFVLLRYLRLRGQVPQRRKENLGSENHRLNL
jgi:Flp pilus assembly protein TadB